MIRVRILDTLAWILARTPLPVADVLARALAWTWWTVLPVRREVALDNLARALPEVTERGPVLRRMLHDLALGYVEVLHLLRDPAAGRRMVALEGVDRLRASRSAGRGVLVCGGHLGAWDLALLAAGLEPDLPLTCIVREPTDSWAAALVARARRRCGVDTLPPRGSMDQVYRALEAGRIVIFTLDQRVDDGLAVPFLGRPAPTAVSLAAAARRTGCPVHLVHQWREGPGRHRLSVEPALDLAWTDDRNADLWGATVRFSEALAGHVRARPHGWLWLHRRWGRA